MMMNPSYNQMSFGNQSPTNFNQGVVMGGYPQGYPPVMPQQSYGGYGYPNMNPYQSPYSPFIAPPSVQQQTTDVVQPGVYVPGAISPPQLEDRNGNTVQAPTTGYIPGGSTISQGGYNPASGMSSMAMGNTGYNPYTRFIGNPMYSAPQTPQQPGYAPYTPPPINPYYNRSPYMSPYQGYGYGMGYPQTQFDTELLDILYHEEPSMFDVREMLDNVILTDEERAKIDHNRNYQNYIAELSEYTPGTAIASEIANNKVAWVNGERVVGTLDMSMVKQEGTATTGYDYYGRPIYSQNAYNQNQQRQTELEQARKSYQEYFTKLSRIAHAYDGEEIDEAATMKRFDPIPQQQYQKPFNYYTATDEEKKEYERNALYERCKGLEDKFREMEVYNERMRQMKLAVFDQIKASHDRLIGVEPGQHYDLKTFLDNGYKIGVNLAMQKAKSANRNGTNKYSRNDFRANLARQSNSPVPITSKDNEYVSIEQALKRIFDKNRNEARQAIMQQANGQMTYTSVPSGTAEDIAHINFMRDVQEKKLKDDIRRAVV